MENQEFNVKLTIDGVNLILRALGNERYIEVVDTIVNLKTQCEEQMRRPQTGQDTQSQDQTPTQNTDRVVPE